MEPVACFVRILCSCTLCCMPRRRLYQHQLSGWILVTDPWHRVMCWIDCRSGGAQEAYEELCRDFERVGWELQERSFDSRFMRRGNVRWQVLITQAGPHEGGIKPGLMSSISR